MRALALAAFAALAGPALAANNPFLPTPDAPARMVRALAPQDMLARDAIEAFEAETGTQVALDAYADAAEFAQRTAEQKYDVVVLRGPALARRIAAGGLKRLDRRWLANAKYVQPALAQRFALYDHDGAYGVPLGWSAFGLIYDADHPAPASWAQALGLAKERAPECGIVWPNRSNDSFFAVWRLMGVDLAHVKIADVKTAAQTLEKARVGFLAFAAPDEAGAFAKGAACLGAGTAGEAAAAVTRGGDTPANVKFAYPKEGAPMAIYALAVPVDAPAPDAAWRLIDALLAPETERRASAAAGLIGAVEPVDAEAWRRLVSEPLLDPAVEKEMQSEWKRLTGAK